MFMTLNPEYNIYITVTSTGTFTQTAIREPRNIKLIGCLVYVFYLQYVLFCLNDPETR